LRATGRRPSPLFLSVIVAALLASLVLGGLAVGILASTRAKLDQAASALKDTQQRNSNLGRQLESAQSEQKAIAARLAALESELNDQPNVPRTAKTASKSVFTIEVPDASGSGFAVAHEAGRTVVVTNFHVVARTYVNGGREVAVRREGLTYDGTIIDASESNDLAVISVRGHLPVLDLVKDSPTIGEPVLALGSPLGLGGTVTSGFISALRTDGGLDYLQFSAPISPGNSGGPVIDSDGKVLGVAVWKVVGDGAEGLGFAIPTTRVCAALDVC
jgi:putative serine protease PepD